MAEVASAYVTLLPSAKGFGARTSKELSGPLDASGREGGKRFGRGMSTGIGSLGSKIFAPLAAAAAGIGVASFFKDAVAGASDLNESTTKIQAIFGNATGAVQDFAKQGAKALGQTQLQVLDAAASFGTFGKAAGLQGPKLAKFSTGLAGLSTDLASFFNTSPEEAAQAISAGLRGESEPLRQYGVLLDDATLRQEALKQGLIKTTKQALTPQQKVLAAQAVIYKQTKDAQGDFARTSGGLANQQRILSAQFSDFRTNIGKALLPVVLKVVTALNGMGPVIKRVGAFLAPVKEAFVVFFEALKGGEVTTIGPLGRIGDAAYAIRDAFLSALPKVMSIFRLVVGVIVTQVVPAVKTFASYIVANVVPILVTLGQIVVTKIVPAFLAVARFVYGQVYPAIIAIVVAVASRLKPVLDQLFATIKARVIPVIQLVAVKFQQWWPTIQKVVSFVVTLIGWVLKLAASILGKVLPVVIRFAGFLLTVVVKALIGVIEFVAKVDRLDHQSGHGCRQRCQEVRPFERGVLSAVGKVLKFFVELPSKVLGAVGDVGHLLYDVGADMIRGAINGIASMAGAIKDKVVSTLTAPIDAAKRKLGIKSPSKVMAKEVGRWIPLGVAKGIDSEASAVRSSMVALAGSVRRPQVGAGVGQVTAVAAGAAGAATFHLYDADGVLLGTMRGEARREMSAAARSVRSGRR